MPTSWKTTVFLTLLALVFTLGLTFAAVELPRITDSYLRKTVTHPQIVTGMDQESELKTQIYLKHYNLRLIGYLALALLVVFIVIGLTRNREKLSSAGAILLFLPVFGHFAATMFFLGGLGFLRLLWLPFLDLSFAVMKLGDIILLPYKWILEAFSSIGINLGTTLPYIFVGLGLFIFLLGTLAWFHSKIRRKKVADFWIYKVSRHPQYLGWIIWSYGLLFLPGPNMRQCYSLSNTLPWLLSTMLIIGIALVEELKMKKAGGSEYLTYQEKTPFLFPLPGWFKWILKSPLKILYKKNHFTRKREVLVVLLLYTFFFMTGSGLYNSNLFTAKPSATKSPRNLESIVHKIKTAANRMVIRDELESLVQSGGNALPFMLPLLKESNYILRWYTAEALGNFSTPEVARNLIPLLHDPEPWVRKTAARSLGSIKSTEAVLPLIEALGDSRRNMAKSAAWALGRIKDPRAIDPLIQTLKTAPAHIAGEAALSLAGIGGQKAIPYLTGRMENPINCPFYQIGSALHALGSDQAITAFKAELQYGRNPWLKTATLRFLAEINRPEAVKAILSSLEDTEPRVRRAAVLILKDFRHPGIGKALGRMLRDPDFEVRIYAQEALRIQKRGAKES